MELKCAGEAVIAAQHTCAAGFGDELDLHPTAARRNVV